MANTELTCRDCGKPLAAELMGLYPQCMLKAGLGTMATQGPRETGAHGFEPPSPQELSAKFPQLEIMELLGRGGMGAVYKVRQKQLDRIVALKILPPGVGDDPAFADRFTREARALAALSHPNIVTLYEFGQADGLFYFLMEFVDGVCLRQLLDAGKLAPTEALAIVPQICDALQYAHDRGIVHRDIKPANILLNQQGQVKIADFGVAKIVGTRDEATRPRGEVAQRAAIATMGQGVVGTPQYTAPEQIERPTEVDHRADIYSLGVVFYQMLTGELPEEPIEPPSRKVQIDVRLDEVVLRALAREPQRRYSQANVLKTEVQTIAETQPGAGPTARTARIFGWEYRSQRTLWGLPLLHVAMGFDPSTGEPRKARGVLAIGNTARGIIAMGGSAYGLIAFGGFSVGLVSIGGLALGAIAFGGLAAGLLLAYGGLALALIAFGGLAIGYYSMGGGAWGVHAAGGNVRDPAALAFFGQSLPYIISGIFYSLFVALMVLYGALLLLGRRWARTRPDPDSDDARTQIRGPAG